VAELTNLETKLGEVAGLAMAAQAATEKVVRLAEDDASELVPALQRMHSEAEETEQRCLTIIETIEGKKTAILEESSVTKRKGAEMLKTYLDDDADALDGFEFLTMAEAGEVGHWEILGRFNKRARNPEVKELVSWGFPIQKRHLTDVRASSLQLVDQEDPDEAA
jgi:hypothetical protein